MIFVTVGAQMAFDRLIRAVDQWVGLNGRDDFFAQTGPSVYRPRYLRHVRFLQPARFRDMFQEAALVVAHAGMGSIITALEMAKPILVMPRRSDLAETRNDHQVATAQRFAKVGAVHVAMDAKELFAKLNGLIDRTLAQPSGYAGCRLRDGSCSMQGQECGSAARRDLPCPNLLEKIQAFIQGTPVVPITHDFHHHSRS